MSTTKTQIHQQTINYQLSMNKDELSNADNWYEVKRKLKSTDNWSLVSTINTEAYRRMKSDIDD